MKVFVSTINFGFGSIPDVFGQLGSGVYRAMEVSSGHPWDANSWHVISEYARKHDASVLFHNHAPPGPDNLFINLSHPDERERERVIGFLKSRIDYTKEIGSDYYSFHGGYRVPYQFGVRNYDPSQRLGQGDALRIFIEAVMEVVAHAEAQRVHVGVENHVVERGNQENLILYGAEDFETMLDQVGSEYLHVHFDAGHLKVTSSSLGLDRQEFIRRLGPKIMGAHFHENDGIVDSHGAFGPDFWVLDELSHLSQLRYACLETSRQDGVGIEAMMQMLEESTTVG